MKKYSMLFVSLFLLWCILSWAVDREHIIAGLVVSAIVAAIAGGLPAGEKAHTALRRFWLLFCVAGLLLADLAKSSVAAAVTVVLPAVPEHAGIVDIEMHVKSDIARALLANAVTFLPGAMTVDLQQEGARLSVHLADTRKKGALLAGVSKYEALLMKLFG